MYVDPVEPQKAGCGYFGNLCTQHNPVVEECSLAVSLTVNLDFRVPDINPHSDKGYQTINFAQQNNSPDKITGHCLVLLIYIYICVCV